VVLDTAASNSLGLIKLFTFLALLFIVLNLVKVSQLMLLRIAFMHCLDEMPIELRDMITEAQRRRVRTGDRIAGTRINHLGRMGDIDELDSSNALNFDDDEQAKLSHRSSV
jgi:hypothetical protein